MVGGARGYQEGGGSELVREQEAPRPPGAHRLSKGSLLSWFAEVVTGPLLETDGWPWGFYCSSFCAEQQKRVRSLNFDDETHFP